MTSLSGKAALISGAAGGIGRAIACAFAREGAAVALCDLAERRDALERVAEECRGEALALEADVADEAAVEAVVEAALRRFGRIDILVNNAGIILEAPLTETTTAQFDRIVAVNLRGTFLLGRAVLRHMAGAGTEGRVINLASDLGYLGRAGFSAYCSTKGAILALTRSWAREFAPGILINAIAPGPIETDMLSPASMSKAWLEKEKDIPLARFGAPEEVAAAAVFLAGPSGSFMTGQTLGPNGGSVMP
jgi:3-oxoacyl-[acyl-carrier protein] reductase